MRNFFKFFAVITTAFLINGSAIAESECKGQKQSSCKADSECVWVGSYKRKDGTEVSSYCRSKGEHGKTKKAEKKKDKGEKKSKKVDKDEKKTDTKKKSKSDEKKSKTTKKKTTKKKSTKDKK